MADSLPPPNSPDTRSVRFGGRNTSQSRGRKDHDKDDKTSTRHTVLILDDDPAILRGLDHLLTAHGYQVQLHMESGSFFRAGLPSPPACLILDNKLGNGTTGLQVHAEMKRRGWDIPTVFITAHWNVQSVVSTMRAGADGFLPKPFSSEDLLAAVQQAIQASRVPPPEGSMPPAAALAPNARLTPREREIVRWVASGMPNKEIATQLNISLDTVKVHRGRAMRKLGAGNAAQLTHIAALLGISC